MSSDENSGEYRIRRFTENGLRDLEELYKAVYGVPVSPGYFLKKYNTVYTGAEYLGYIAYNVQNIAVAYYGVIPHFIEYDGQLVLSAQSGDTMTHPRYRYKGLFVELATITFGLCREAGIRFIFGFPNQHSYHGFIHKLGWKVTETMECFVIAIPGLPLASLPRRFKWLGAAYRKYCALVLKKYILPQQGTPNSVTDEGYGGVYRDNLYLDYKTYSSTKVIQTGDAKIWIKIRDTLMIGDICLGREDFDATMVTLKKIARRLGIREISFHASPGTRLHDLFKTRYPGISSFPVIFKDLGSGIDFDKLKFTLSDIDIF